ncbi:hypothetical protein ASB1_16550 [Helicobacter heilmannii]|nr:hypothetical protein ASB1_16550 [Helicobacter heilmannii]
MTVVLVIMRKHCFIAKRRGICGVPRRMSSLLYENGNCDKYKCAVKPNNKKALQYYKKAGDMGEPAGYYKFRHHV